MGKITKNFLIQGGLTYFQDSGGGFQKGEGRNSGGLDPLRAMTLMQPTPSPQGKKLTDNL